jgi:phage terminase large subunit
MKRVESGRMIRFRSRHTDNPLLWDQDKKRWTEEGEAYMGILRALKGVAYQRQYLGEWTTAEGAVWESFDPINHVIPCPVKEGQRDYEALGIKGWIGSIDWGFTKPGSFQIWGVSDGEGHERRMVLAREYYSTQKTLEWWADRVMQAWKIHPFDIIVADPSRNDNIQLMNDMLVRKGFRAIVRPADNKRRSTQGDLAGLDLVRWGFYPDPKGIPRILLIADALQERDEVLVSASKPYSTETEIPLFVFSQDNQGRINEETDPRCEDHGCDALRYAAMWVWKRQVKTHVIAEREYGGWSNSGMFGTPRSLLLARLKSERNEEPWTDEDP